MAPTWLIEADVYGTAAEPLRREIRRQGMAAATVPYRAVRPGAAVAVGGRALGPGACVLGYGTAPFAEQILARKEWTPGAWCAVTNFDCATYYPRFGHFLLNRRCAIVPVPAALAAREHVFKEFGVDGRVFVRPAAGRKLFPGRCVTEDEFVPAVAPARYDPEARVVVAAPQRVTAEWRLVVVDGAVVAASGYAVGGAKALSAGCPAAVLEFAARVLAEVPWRPDPAFMLDVGECDGDYAVVELNTFSGSGLYAAPLRPVVAAAAALAGRP